MSRIESYKIYRFIGIWDLILTLPFALPFLNRIVINLLKTINSYLSPLKDFSEFSDLNLFFVQLFGILAVLWAVVRIHKPGRFLAIYDTLGRSVVAVSMILFTVNGGSFVPLLFSISEIGFGILQLVFIIKKRENILKDASAVYHEKAPES